MEQYASTDLQIQNILVPVDFSDCSQKALLYALNIARRYNAKLTLLHIVPPQHGLPGHPRGNEPLRAAWREMKQLQADLLSKGTLRYIHHQIMVKRGTNWKVISRTVKRQDTDLIVLGTRGRTGLKKLILGSFAECVFRQASCPVLTVGPRIPEQQVTRLPRHLLFPTGDSYVSKCAEPYAFQAARDYGAQLTVLGVFQRGLLPNGRADDEHRKHLEERLQSSGLMAAWRAGGAAPNVVAEIGSKVNSVLRVAETMGSDLIAVGISPDSGAPHEFGWADAYHLVCSAPCPVLTVRHTLADPYFKRLLRIQPVCMAGQMQQ